MTKNYWIFVIKNTDEEFARRIKKNSWPIYTYTVNRKKIQSGDGVVFYQAGEGNKILLGTADTSSAIKGKEREIDYVVDLCNVVIWKKRVLIKPLVCELDFIDNKNQWGQYMQGGVIRISEKDYSVLGAKSK